MKQEITKQLKLPLKIVMIVFWVMICLINAQNTNAQTVVTLGGGASVTCPATPAATYTTAPSGVGFGQWVRGSGITCASASDALSGSNFNNSTASANQSANKFYSITLTADASHSFTLNAITWLTTVSGSGGTPSFTIMYKNNGGAVTQFGTTGTSQTSNSFTGTVSVAANTSVVIYFVPANVAATGATVRLKNGTSITVTAATLTPAISPATNTFAAFTTVYGTASAAKTIAVTGSNLTTNITATAAAGFEVANDGATYGASTSFVQSGGNASGTLSVRLKANTAVSGSYNSITAVTLTSTGAVSRTYTTSASGNSVTARSITGSFSASNKMYDGNNSAAVTARSLTGVLAGDIGNITLTGGTASFANANAANGKTVTLAGATLSGAAAGNYSLSAVSTATADITALSISITPNAGQFKSFGSADPVLNYNSSVALISPDVYTGALGRVAGETPGTYAFTLGSLSAGGNYNLSLAGVSTFLIQPVSQPVADFRSKANGNFSVITNWEYDLGGGTWTNATQLPTSENNVGITHSITLDQDYTVGISKTFTLGTGAVLTVSPANTLSVNGTANFNGHPVTFKSDATGTASLGQVSGTLNGATNVTVERYIRSNGFRSWRLLSVPTYGSGQTIKQAWQENQAALANNNPGYGTQITTTGASAAAVQAQGFDNTSTYAALLKWNGTGWVNETTTLQPIANQKAWFLFVRGDRSKGNTGGNFDANATTLRTNGTVYTGDQVNTIGTNAFALVANVYPSAISFTGLTRTGGVSNTFYIWDSKKLNGNSLGAYQTFSSTNGFNCILGGGSYTLGQPNTVIESGQAFFVQSTTAGTITLKETAKVSSISGSLGLRPAALPATIDSRLYNSNNEMLDANTVVFDAAYSKAVEAADAPKMGNPGANFAIETASKLFAVEGTAPVQDNDVVQFRMWNLQPQAYQLEIAASKLAADGLTAVLEDKYLHTATVIDLNSSIRVNFTVDANPGSADANRFRIVFKKAAIAIADSRKGYSIAPNPVENGIANIHFHNQPAGKYHLKIINHSGQCIMESTINHAGGSSRQLLILPGLMASGIYQLQITAPDKSTSLQQIVVGKR